MDNGTAVSGTTAATTISGSTNIFSTQTSYTALNGAINTTIGNNMYMNFTWTSGAFYLRQCLLETEAAY
jgi:hypothetical protein